MDEVTVFIVDDDDSYRELLVLALEGRPGLRVREFNGGQAAIDALRAHAGGDRPSLMLLDLHMPGMGGLALLREIRTRGDTTPVAVLSHAATPKEREECARAGAQFVLKPHGFEDLRQQLLSLLERAQQEGHG